MQDLEYSAVPNVGVLYLRGGKRSDSSAGLIFIVHKSLPRNLTA